MEEKATPLDQKSDNNIQAKMHEGEIIISAVLVKHLLMQQYPHLAEKSIEVVQSMGTVNAIFRLDQDLLVRLPRLETWAESIDREYT